MNITPHLSILLATALLTRADVLPPSQDSSSLKGKLTVVTGKATTLAVSAARKSYVLFDLNSLPSDVQQTDIASARLRVYFPATKKTGDISIHSVTTAWNETSTTVEPSISISPIAIIPTVRVIAKKFTEVDVTNEVRAWRAGTNTNYGFGFVASGLTNVLIGAKEGPGSGYPCELEVEISRELRSNLTLSGTTSGIFSGNGVSLTNLSASNLSSGTLGDTRLSENVPLLNKPANTFTGNVSAIAFIGDGSGLTGVNASSFADAPSNVMPALGMVWIKPGTFLMGSPASELGRGDDETQHSVTLTKGFYMGVHEVTQAEYQSVLGNNPSAFTGDANRPVEQVTWSQATTYCATLTNIEQAAGRIPSSWSYRLPTEAEWEYCCRAGARTTRFGYGDDLNAAALTNYAWYSSNSGNTTHPVEQKHGNAWGLMDMHGNVFEWCLDYFDAYPAGSAIDPQGPKTGTWRASRGGSWGYNASFCRSAQRGSNNPDLVSSYFGFRVVLAPVLQ